MKKSNFAALTLGTASAVFFALGMCMTLLPEWNSFKLGIIFGCIGIALGIVTVFIWRKAKNKAPIKANKRTIAVSFVGISGALTFGVGMCFCMVWENIVLGVVIGLIGIFALLSLIPLVKGIR